MKNIFRISNRYAIAAVLGVGAVFFAPGCRKQETKVPAVSASAASQPANPGSGAVELNVPSDTKRQALDNNGLGPATSRPSANWSGGQMAFDGRELIYTIKRDYNQQLAVPVRNLSSEPRVVLATLQPFEEGLLADFVGAGSTGHPLQISAGAAATLAIHAYAQDATRTSYRATAFLRDATTGLLLAAAPITVFVDLPAFSVTAHVGPEAPGTLARKITVHNDGAALTDFSVRAGPGLEGQVILHPTMEHVYLGSGDDVSFLAAPRLETDFTKAQGSLILSGAGQKISQAIDFSLPPGKHVYVATSFSITSFFGLGKYCTNNPNTDTTVSGPATPPDDPYPLIGSDPNDPMQKYYRDGTPNSSGKSNSDVDDQGKLGKLADWLNKYVPSMGVPGTSMGTDGRFHWGDSHFGADMGAAPGSDPNGPIIDINYNAKIGPFNAGPSGHTTIGINPNVSDTVNINSNNTPTGSQLNQSAQDGNGNAGPRGLRVRDDYATFRSTIYLDNEPEAMLAVSSGTPENRVILQTWHTNRWSDGAARQIVLRIWDGLAQRRLSADLILSDKTAFGQWPAVLPLPDNRALVVWETSTTWHGPPSLACRISDSGYGHWSPVLSVPGSSDPAGAYDPAPVLGADGHVRVFWQQGRDAMAKIMFTRSTDSGDLAPAAEVRGLPAGAARPLVRVADDGTIHLLCQVYTGQAAVAAGTPQPESTSAVYYALSHDGGANFEQPMRLSPDGADAGEPDLLIAGQKLEAVFRAGPEWASRIFYLANQDGGRTWASATPITPEDQYAEYPVILSHDGATEVEYYGDDRSSRDLPPAGSGKATAAPPSQARAVLKKFAVAASDGWASSRRLLTHFQAIQAAWLEVNFELRTPRASYSPHEITVMLNGVPLTHQTNVIPEGTYLLPFDPKLLEAELTGLPRNVISLRTVHMSPGHYLTAANFRLEARHAFREVLVVADNQQAADAIAAGESEQVNHARADVGVFARFVESPDTAPLLPATPGNGQAISLPVRVANLGEVSAADVVLQVYEGGSKPGWQNGKPVGQPMTIGTLAPLELRDVNVQFNYGGASVYYIVAAHDGADFDPSNDVYQVSFATPTPPSIQAQKTDQSQPVVATFGDDPQAPFQWRILDAQSQKEIAVVRGSTISAPIPPGQYRLALTRYQNEGQEVIFPRPVEKKADEPLRISLYTAVEMSLPSWAPVPYRWELCQADHPDQIVQWLTGAHPVMLVPPGDYRLALKPTQFDGKWVTWPQVIHVEQDEHVVVNLDSAIEPPPALANRAAPYRWGLRPDMTSDDEQTVQEEYGAWLPMLVPPGKYVWGIQPLRHHSLWTPMSTVKIAPGQRTQPPEPAYISLIPSKWSGNPFSFGIVDSASGKEIQHIEFAAATDIPVPAGKYDLLVQPWQYHASKPISILRAQAVASGHALRVSLDTGLQLSSSMAKAPWRIDYFREGDKEPVQRWEEAVWGATPLPPGDYHVSIQPQQYRCLSVLWPGTVHVESGKLAKLVLDSGADFQSPANRKDAKPPWRVTYYRQGQSDPVQQLTEADWGVTLLPPGQYRVGFQPQQYRSREVLWTTPITIESGKITAFSLDGGISVQPGNADIKPDAPWRVSFQRRGQADPVQQIEDSGWVSATLPPGDYQITIRPTQYDSEGLTWPGVVTVEAGKTATLNLDSGIRIVGSAGQQPEFEFQILDDKGKLVQRGGQTWAAQIVPPGIYKVQVRRHHGQWHDLGEAVTVEASKFIQIPMDHMPEP